MYIVYLLTFPNGKKYVGRTRQKLCRRLRDHACRVSLVGNAIRKCGADNVKCDILAEGLTLKMSGVFEKNSIENFNTLYPCGYNLTSGGDGVVSLSNVSRNKISESRSKRVMKDSTRKKLSKAMRRRWAEDSEFSPMMRNKHKDMVKKGGQAFSKKYHTDKEFRDRQLSILERGRNAQTKDTIGRTV